MENYKMWIGGKWVEAESGKTFTVVNPATEEVVAQVPLGGKADVDKAVAAARQAFPEWSGKSPGERSEIARRIATAMREHASELAEVEVIDHGTLRKNLLGRVSEWAEKFEWAAAASKAMNGELITIDLSKKLLLQYEPIGVAALITPWNAPLNMVATKLSAAMAVGNTCVLKPPSVDSLPALKLAEVLAELDITPGVVNIVTGPGGSVGEALSTHPDVGVISFTGSCETGKRIMELAGRTIKRVQLELGGKNPVIVLEDADIDAVVASSVMGQTGNTGQTCGSPGRYYLHERIRDEFVEKFVDRASKIVVGDPNDEKTQMGPLVSAEHRDRVEGYIRSGIEEGAKLILGGERLTKPPLDKGYFVMPTVFTNVVQNMKIAREEIFGPVACIMEPFSSEDKVIELANDNTFGLSTQVWTRDTAKGIRFADRLCAGTIIINRFNSHDPERPWGGFKESGIGKEGGRYGLEDLTQLKVISVDKGA